MSQTNKIPNAFCPLPWMHLATHPNGCVSLCCRINYAEDEGFAESTQKEKINLNNQSLAEAMNSDSFKKARVEMLQGRWPKACVGCEQLEKSGLQSKRLYEIDQFKPDFEALRKKTAPDGGLLETRLEFIELRLGNKCNLKCRTCNPHSSIAWTPDYKALEQTLPFVQKYPAILVDWCEDPQFWRDLELHLAATPRFYINGGEPTLIEAHWNFLEKLVSAGKSSGIELFYNSNMTHLPEKAFSLWAQFRKVSIGASIDAIGERNHYIRYPAQWKKIEAHVDEIKKRGLHVDVTQTVSAMNFLYLDEMLLWARDRQLHVEFNFVYDPSFLAAQALPQKVRASVLENKKLRLLATERQWQQISTVVEADENPGLWPQFIAYTKQLDTLRKQDFKKTFPEMMEVLRKHHYEF